MGIMLPNAAKVIWDNDCGSLGFVTFSIVSLTLLPYSVVDEVPSQHALELKLGVLLITCKY